MPKSHLVPTRVTNVNGISTPVYRRPVAQVSGVTTVPAPVLAQNVERVDDDRTILVNQAYELAAARDDDPDSTVGNIHSLEGMLNEGTYSAVEQVVKDELL